MKNSVLLLLLCIIFEPSFGQLKVYIPNESNFLVIPNPILKRRYSIDVNAICYYVTLGTNKGEGMIEVWKNDIFLIKCEYQEDTVLCKDASFAENVITGKYMITYYAYYFPRLKSFTKYKDGDSTKYEIEY